MADGVLFVGGELGKGAIVTVGSKDGIVTESAGTMFFGGDMSTDFALKEVLLSAVGYKGDDGAEASPAVGHAIECGKQFANVGGAVAVLASVAR